MLIHFISILLCFSLMATNTIWAQWKKRYSIQIPNGNLEQAMRQLTQASKMNINYDAHLLKQFPISSKIFEQESLKDIVEELIEDKPLNYIQSGVQLLIIPAKKPFRRYKPKFTIAALVVEAESLEPIPGCYITSNDAIISANTNAAGYFSMMSNQKQLSISLNAFGYQKLDTVIWSTDKEQTLIISLQPEAMGMNEIVFTASKLDIPFLGNKMTLGPSQLSMSPSLLGGKDLMRALQLMPGIQQSKDGSTGLIVRGGDPEQNLNLLDGANVYAPYHILGIFSNFNNAIVKQVNVQKANFDAQYGGRLSSIIDVITKDGNAQKIKGSFEIGLLSSQLHVEGPIIKDKSTFVIAARRTYWDWLLAKSISSIIPNVTTLDFHFFDINAKLQHRINERNTLQFATLIGGDKYVYQDEPDAAENATDFNLNWNNVHYTFKWNHIWNDKSFSNLLLFHTNYLLKASIRTYAFEQSTIDFLGLRTYSGVKDWGLKYDWETKLAKNAPMQAGLHATLHQMKPGQDVSQSNWLPDESIKGAAVAIYGAYQHSISKQLTLQTGLHLGSFFAPKKSYWSAQPRLKLTASLANNFNLEAGYAKMTQFVHRLSQYNWFIPTEIWIPATANIQPQISHQVAATFQKRFEHSPLRIQVEPFYKWMKQLTYIRPNAVINNAALDQLQQYVLSGNGKAYGVDFFIEKPGDKFHFWIAYTLSKATRQFEQVNEGALFAHNFDRRHDFKVNANLKISKYWAVNADWIYQSPLPVTVPTGWYDGLDPNDHSKTLPLPIYTKINNKRLDPYHRLDMALRFRKKKKYWTKEWNLGIYNLYSRVNPQTYYPTYKEGKATLTGLDFFRFTPSISYGISF